MGSKRTNSGLKLVCQTPANSKPLVHQKDGSDITKWNPRVSLEGEVEQLAVEVSVIEELIESGKLPVVEFSPVRRVLQSDLVAFVLRHRSTKA